MSSAPRLPPRYQPHPEFAKAERLFWHDLPKLLPTKAGRWVVYTSKGRIMEGADGVVLEQECQRRGLRTGQYLVARVEPDAPVADIPLDWCS